MNQRSLDERVKSAFLLAGKILLAIFTGIALVGGIYWLRWPNDVVRANGNISLPHSRLPSILNLQSTQVESIADEYLAGSIAADLHQAEALLTHVFVEFMLVSRGTHAVPRHPSGRG